MTTTSSLTAEQFNTALNNTRARRGDIIAYHVGLLMQDRLYHVEVDNVARAAWKAHTDGRVALMQRRVNARDCQYMAVVL